MASLRLGWQFTRALDGPLYPQVAYTIFRHTLAESTTFAPGSETGMWYFRPGYGEKIITMHKQNICLFLLFSYLIIIYILKLIYI